MAIARDSVSSVFTESGTNPITRSFTNTAGNLLVVGVSIADLTTTLTMTYNGVNMTVKPEGGNTYAQSGTSSNRSVMFYLFSPSVGTNDLVITRNTGTVECRYQIASYSGMNTSGLFGTGVNGSSGTPTSCPITTTADDCWVMGFIWAASGTLVDTASCDFLGTTNFGLFDSGAGVGTAGVKSTVFSGGGSQWSNQSAAFAPAAAASSNSRFLMMGIG